MNSSNWKTIAVVVASVLFLTLIVFSITKVSFNNSAADAETLVIQAKDECAVTYDNGMKAVIEMAQVDTNTKEFLKSMFDKQSPTYHQFPAGQSQQIQQAYGEFVNGNPAQLMFLLGGISGTNFTVTAENTQREIGAQRAAMSTCAKTLVATQRELRKVVGMDASGRIVKWPQSQLGLDYPSMVNDPNLQDNDQDGVLTVLDYRPPVDVKVMQSFGTGEGIPAGNIYGQP